MKSPRMDERPTSQQRALRATPTGQRPSWRFLTSLSQSMDVSPRLDHESQPHKPVPASVAHGFPGLLMEALSSKTPLGGGASSASREEILTSAAAFDWSAMAVVQQKHLGSMQRGGSLEKDAPFAVSSPRNPSLMSDDDEEFPPVSAKLVRFADMPNAKKTKKVTEGHLKPGGKASMPTSGTATPPRGSLLDRPGTMDGRRTSHFAFEERLDVVRGVMSQAVEDLLQSIPDFDEDQMRTLRALTDCREKAFRKEYPSLHPTGSSSSSVFNTVSGGSHSNAKRPRLPKGPTVMTPEPPKPVPRPPSPNWIEEKRQAYARRGGGDDMDDLPSAAPKQHVYLPLKELNDAHIQKLMPQQAQAVAELAALGLM